MQPGNGKIIGKNNIPTVSQASGIWGFNEVQRNNESGVWPYARDYLTDSYAANLFIALPLTTYRSSITGGGYADVAPNIRTQLGLTPGTAKTATATGNTSFNNVVPSTFASYTDNLVFNAATLYYYTHNVSAAQQLTVELWLYHPSTRTNSYTLMATNNFGGGGYPAWSWGTNYPIADNLNWFTNTAPSGHRSSTAGLIDNAWNHIAFCCNGTDNLKQFINGTKVYDGAYGPNGGQSLFSVGATSWDGVADLTGVRFQDFRIYTGVQKYTNSFTVNKGNPNFGGRILA